VRENRSNWLFVDESRDDQFDVEHTVHDAEPTVAHEDNPRTATVRPSDCR